MVSDDFEVIRSVTVCGVNFWQGNGGERSLGVHHLVYNLVARRPSERYRHHHIHI